MNQLQRGYERGPRSSLSNRHNVLRMGKVIKSNPEAKTVDVTMIDCSGTYHDVPVLAPFASTSSGISHLPAPHNPKDEDESGYSTPIGYDKRDVYAIIGFVEGEWVLPVVLGFKYPETNQMSFPDSIGANQKIDRHEGDRYHRITGDTVSENGGEDVSSEEEIRYPDHSYFKVVKTDGTRELTDLSSSNRDAEDTPFQLKKEGSKGFYFQHSSGTKVYIGHYGEIKVSHQAGAWISIGPDTGDLAAATAGGATIDSKNDPPANPDGSTPQVHIGHPSGTYLTIDISGNITLNSGGSTTITSGTVFVDSSDVTVGNGPARALLDERSHTYLGAFVAELNAWLNNHTHPDTSTPNQTAALPSPPVITEAATVNTVAS